MLESLATLSAADKRTRALAGTMFELNAGGTCTEALLLAEGFSQHELATYGNAARALANHRFVKKLDAVDEQLTDEEIIALVLDRCGGLLGAPAIIAQLRGAKIPSETIARLWEAITAKLATCVAKLPHLTPADLPKAFA